MAANSRSHRDREWLILIYVVHGTGAINMITTFLDHRIYDKQSIADLYGFRWNTETDLGHLKGSPESLAYSVQIDREGSSITLDHAIGVQLDSDNGCRCGTGPS